MGFVFGSLAFTQCRLLVYRIDSDKIEQSEFFCRLTKVLAWLVEILPYGLIYSTVIAIS